MPPQRTELTGATTDVPQGGRGAAELSERLAVILPAEWVPHEFCTGYDALLPPDM
jgi:hypothetical protein